jgi:hypothetical protein
MSLLTFKNRYVESLHHELIIAVADQKDPVPCVIDPEPYTSDWSSRKNASADSANDLCIDCPLMQQCLEFGLANEESYGIYGGTLPRDRIKLT